MAETIFFRLLASENKGGALLDAIGALRQGRPDNPTTYAVEAESFRQVPGTPFAYWVSERIRRLFTELPPFEGDGRTVKSGLCTVYDFRFVRAWWEVPVNQIMDAEHGPEWRADLLAFQKWCRHRTSEGKCWISFAKGGVYSPYFADLQLVVNWSREGMEIRAGASNGSLPGARPQNTGRYFAPGLSYTARISLRLCATPLAAGSVFAHVGPAIFPCVVELEVALARFNSYAAEAFLAPFHARGTQSANPT